MFPGLAQHCVVQGWRDEDAFLLKPVQRFNQFFGCQKALFLRFSVLLGHTIFNELSALRVEKVHHSKHVFVRGSWRRQASALCSRDFTVPSGMLKTSAISARLRPSTKRSSNTSRCSSERTASAAISDSFWLAAGSVVVTPSVIPVSFSSD